MRGAIMRNNPAAIVAIGKSGFAGSRCIRGIMPDSDDSRCLWPVVADDPGGASVLHVSRRRPSTASKMFLPILGADHPRYLTLRSEIPLRARADQAIWLCREQTKIVR